MTASWIQYACLLALFALSGRTDAQEICACTPSTYTFEFNFDRRCPTPDQVDINGAGGISATFCSMNELTDGDAPVEVDPNLNVANVTQIDVIELGQDFGVVGSTPVFDVSNGDVFTGSVEFESIISTMELSRGDTRIPKVMQVNIFAVNDQGNEIINFFAISFTNDCNTYEVVDNTSTAGWVDFVSYDLAEANTELSHFLYATFSDQLESSFSFQATVTPPPDVLCDAYSDPSESPSGSPTPAPTPEPTSAPTPAPTPEPTAAPSDPPTPGPTSMPTVAPTPGPTPPPTDAPTSSPTVAPTPGPTPALTTDPTPGPTVAPTPAPTAEPTGFPTMSMSMSMELSMSMSMSMALDTEDIVMEMIKEANEQKLYTAQIRKYSVKSEKSKKGKSAKSEKSKKGKSAKSEKSKSSKRVRRRRLRVRPLFEAE